MSSCSQCEEGKMLIYYLSKMTACEEWNVRKIDWVSTKAMISNI